MRLPSWLKTRHLPDLPETRRLLRRHGLSTVCEEARCPNRGECFAKPTATFLILGPVCTRDCGFCSVTPGIPGPVDVHEPEQVAEAAAGMKLRYVVITSVTRDDLSDGGAGQFARTVTAVRRRLPEALVEVLVPDFRGDTDALGTVLDTRPDVFNHNMETVSGLYPLVRPRADYARSLDVLRNAKEFAPGISTKSGIMLGLGETEDEVLCLLSDLRLRGCDMLTIGQYLSPTRKHLPVVKYVLPETFERLRERALDMGFRFVASAPLVRSSMHAEEMYKGVK